MNNIYCLYKECVYLLIELMFTDLGEDVKIETPQIPPTPRIISAAASSSGILSLQVQYITSGRHPLIPVTAQSLN